MSVIGLVTNSTLGRRLLAGCSLVVLGCSGPDSAPDAEAWLDADSLAAQLSAAFMAEIGDSISHAVEMRFVADGSGVLVLDQYPPHLRLFSLEGTPLWVAGTRGAGPNELWDPSSMVIRGNEATVVQRGRISWWPLPPDSSPARSRPLPPALQVHGVLYDCAGWRAAPLRLEF